MSNYTTQVRWICETAARTDHFQYASIDDIITAAAPEIFNFSFPIFDEAYRLPLERKILRHFYTREICEETVALWKLRLNDKLNMIMPYYNQLYETTLIKFNPLYDVDVTTIGNRNDQTKHEGTLIGVNTKSSVTIGEKEENNIENEKTNENRARDYSREDTRNENDRRTSNGYRQSDEQKSGEYEETSDNTHWNLYSDTPQGGINGINGGGINDPTVENNYYLTTATKDTDDASKEGSTSDTTNRSELNNENANGEFVGAGTEKGEDSEIANGSRDRNNRGTTDSFDSTNESGNFNHRDNRNINTTGDYIDRVVGKRNGMTYSKMIEEFREIILNIDAKIIGELETLFFGLWA